MGDTLAYVILIAGCLLMAAAMILPFVKQARDRADAWVAWRIEEDDRDE